MHFYFLQTSTQRWTRFETTCFKCSSPQTELSARKRPELVFWGMCVCSEEFLWHLISFPIRLCGGGGGGGEQLVSLRNPWWLVPSIPKSTALQSAAVKEPGKVEQLKRFNSLGGALNDLLLFSFNMGNYSQASQKKICLSFKRAVQEKKWSQLHYVIYITPIM